MKLSWKERVTQFLRPNVESGKSLAESRPISNDLTPAERPLSSAPTVLVEDGKEINLHDVIESEYRDSISSWTGITIKELETLDLMKIYEDAPYLLQESEHLQNTVPLSYRGEVKEAASEHSDPVQNLSNSLASISRSATILAIDASGEALVRRHYTSNYEGAEGWDFRVMPKKDAFALLDNFRESHDIVKEFQAERGLLPNNFDYNDIAGNFIATAAKPASEFEGLRAEPRQVYIGPVEHVSDSAVQQRVDDKLVTHDLNKLVGAEFPIILGTIVDIHYNPGGIGIVYHADKVPDLANVYDAGSKERTSDFGM